jgi:hypothetical protein
MDFPLLREREAYEHGARPPAIEAQEAIAWDEHLVIVRPPEAEQATPWTADLRGRSSRIVITTAMPLAYRCS